MASRILIAEPDHIQREAMRLYLSHMLAGSTVTAAENSADALEHARTSGADIVVTAMSLAPLSGIDLIRQLHRDAPELRIIVYTAYDAVRARAIEAGAVQCVTKGSLQQLLQAVQSVAEPARPTARTA